MTKKIIPFTKCDDADLGGDQVTGAVVATIVLLKGGMYKIAAYGPAGFVGIKWRLGLTALTDAEGSFLANGDQEVLYVDTNADADNVNLQVIRVAGSTQDGTTNVVPSVIIDVPTQDPRAVNP